MGADQVPSRRPYLSHSPWNWEGLFRVYHIWALYRHLGIFPSPSREERSRVWRGGGARPRFQTQLSEFCFRLISSSLSLGFSVWSDLNTCQHQLAEAAYSLSNHGMFNKSTEGTIKTGIWLYFLNPWGPPYPQHLAYPRHFLWFHHCPFAGPVSSTGHSLSFPTRWALFQGLFSNTPFDIPD